PGDAHHEMRALLPGAAEAHARRREVKRAPHPQVQAILEGVARSPLPPYHTVNAFVARRIYRDTRAALSPRPEDVSLSRLLLAGGVAVRAYRPAGAAADAVLPALVYYHGGGWTI